MNAKRNIAAENKADIAGCLRSKAKILEEMANDLNTRGVELYHSHGIPFNENDALGLIIKLNELLGGWSRR
jgi:hypothetical protein